jgi:hypothetical protein
VTRRSGFTDRPAGRVGEEKSTCPWWESKPGNPERRHELRQIINKYVLLFVRSQVLTVISVKMAVFWDVAPCSPADTNRRLRGVYCLHHQGDEYCYFT